MNSRLVIEILSDTALEPFVTDVIEIPSGIVWCSGLLSNYPQASTPLADDDKLIVRQGNDWKEVAKSEVGETIKHIQVNELPQMLEANTIYFVRNTGEIWQTDDNGFGVNYTTKEYIFSFGDWLRKDYFAVQYTNKGVMSAQLSNINTSNVETAIQRAPYYIATKYKKISNVAGYILNTSLQDETIDVIVGKKIINSNGQVSSYEIRTIPLRVHNGLIINEQMQELEIKEGDGIFIILNGHSLSGNIYLYSFYLEI